MGFELETITLPVYHCHTNTSLASKCFVLLFWHNTRRLFTSFTVTTCLSSWMFSWKFFVPCFKINCSFPVSCTERLDSWYCLCWLAYLDPLINSQNWSVSCFISLVENVWKNFATYTLLYVCCESTNQKVVTLPQYLLACLAFSGTTFLKLFLLRCPAKQAALENRGKWYSVTGKFIVW